MSIRHRAHFIHAIWHYLLYMECGEVLCWCRPPRQSLCELHQKGRPRGATRLSRASADLLCVYTKDRRARGASFIVFVWNERWQKPRARELPPHINVLKYIKVAGGGKLYIWCILMGSCKLYSRVVGTRSFMRARARASVCGFCVRARCHLPCGSVSITQTAASTCIANHGWAMEFFFLQAHTCINIVPMYWGFAIAATDAC